MLALDHALLTPRLRLEPVTAGIILAAHAGPRTLSGAVGAEPAHGWRGEGLFPLAAVRDQKFTPTNALIVEIGTMRVIGHVRFDRTPLRPNVYEIGYEIAPAYRRQGYAVEATARIIRWLLEEADAARVIAGCSMRNVASVRTLRKLGFHLDGSSARGNAFWWVYPDTKSAS